MTPQAHIYKPAKSAMQSGLANTKKWRLEFLPDRAHRIDDLMGYVGAGNTREQVRLSFDTKEEAIAYAEAHNIPYRLSEPRKRRRVIKAYADNFRPLP